MDRGRAPNGIGHLMILLAEGRIHDVRLLFFVMPCNKYIQIELTESMSFNSNDEFTNFVQCSDLTVL